MTIPLPSRLAVPLILLATVASAQTVSDTNVWNSGTTLGLFGGAAVADSDGGLVTGGTVGWEVRPWFALEGRMGWELGLASVDAFSGSLSARLSMVRPRPVVPFAKVGVGLYRGWFDSPDGVPEFYRRRVPAGMGPGRRHTFTDPTMVLGGGVNIFTSRHIAIRPEVDATFVMGESRVRTVTSFSLHLAYHFEDHPVTPGRR